MAYAKNSSEKEFIIGTESSIVQHLQFECPDNVSICYQPSAFATI